jgi:hypothetical protein
MFKATAMKNFALLMVLLNLMCSTFAQVINLGNENSTLTDIKGEPFLEKKFTDIDGHPFLNDSWQLADVLLISGLAYKNINVRLNIVNQQIHYLTKDSKNEWVIGKGLIKSIEFPTGQTYEIFYDEKGGQLICEPLVTGKCKLLRMDKKIVVEEKMFNSASVTKKFVSEINYYVFIKNRLEKIKKSKKDILELLSDRSIEMEKHIVSTKNKCKTQAELIALIEFYNTIDQ